uniref:SJCHGC02684 protein n=1 Tax=Schistosoma japonicum TaxID=6182 RepID=Q5BT59_SCHJA|nr:SJCHGC02684 protein [Schistosoma japonicum]
MQRPPPIPTFNRHSIGYRSGGNLLNSITPCKEYYTHDSYGKSKYCIEVNLQGYPQESIHITRQLHDVTVKNINKYLNVKFNYHNVLI